MAEYIWFTLQSRLIWSFFVSSDFSLHGHIRHLVLRPNRYSCCKAFPQHELGSSQLNSENINISDNQNNVYTCFIRFYTKKLVSLQCYNFNPINYYWSALDKNK